MGETAQIARRCGWDDTPSSDLRLARALRDHTDLLHARRRVLHIAPQAELRAILETSARLDYECLAIAPVASSAADTLPFVAASFDAVICDGSAALQCSLGEIARILRPGGRALVAAASESDESRLAGALAGAGFFFARFCKSDEPAVFIGVRGE